MYRLAIETGLRAAELRSLMVSSFNFDRLTVQVESAYTKNRQIANLPLRRQTAEQLKTLLAGKMPSVKVFDLPDKSKMAKMLRADCRGAGVSTENIDFHCLRHTAGTLLAASGVHPKTAQTILRHSSIDLTMSIYTHTLRGQEATAIESLPDFSGGKKKTGTNEN